MKKETYIRRRAQLKRDMASGLLLFLGNDEVGMNYADNTYRFRQDSTFFYYFGLDYAGLAAVIDVDNDTEIVFGNELTIDDIVWTGTQPSQASVPFIKAIVSQRNHKDEEELRLIEESVDLSNEMHLAAYRTVRPGIHESEVPSLRKWHAAMGERWLSPPSPPYKGRCFTTTVLSTN